MSVLRGFTFPIFCFRRPVNRGEPQRPHIEPSLVCLCRSVFLDTRRGGASCICSATPGRAWCGLNQGSDRARTHAALTSMCLTLSCASLVFGRLIVRTPFLNDASILAAS